MLTQLHIKNIALVEQLTVEWSNGMTAITGETGAGKSMMLDALNLTLGERANSGLIRVGSDKAEVIASFDIKDKPAAQAFLTDYDINDDDCILRRVLQSDGSSKAWINGTPVTLKQLKTLAEHLIDIHSQHEHQSLLQADTQRQLLDDFGQYNHLLSSVANAWQQWRQCTKQIADLSGSDADFEQQYELLSFQVQEMDAFGLMADDYQTLVEQQQLLSSGSELKQACYQLQQLSQHQELGNIDSFIQSSIRLLEQQSSLPESLVQSLELLNQMDIINRELGDSLRHAEDLIEIDPQQLAVVEERISHLYDLARKHKVAPEQLFEHYQQLQQRMTEMELSRGNLEQLQQQEKQFRQQYIEVAQQLSEQRNHAAQQLSTKINSYFDMLSMQGANLQIQCHSQAGQQGNASGIDSVEFLVRTNLGQPYSSLKKIVSGGELSRISLAISVVTAQTSSVPTMIFDEVDSGIGGATAEVIGKLLNQIGNNAQVICITHLPQVAARANQQLQVMKQNYNEQTIMQMKELDANRRIEEIARMSGGEMISDEARQFAKSLLAGSV